MDFNFFGLQGLGALIQVLTFGWLVATVIVHVCFSIYVAKDARNLNALRLQTFGAGPMVWFLATLIGGVFVAAIYWVIHHSTLRSSAYTPANKT